MDRDLGRLRQFGFEPLSEWGNCLRIGTWALEAVRLGTVIVMGGICLRMGTWALEAVRLGTVIARGELPSDRDLDV